MATVGIVLPNEASIALHKALGFTAIGVFHRAGFKFGAWRDVSLWECVLRDQPPGGGHDRDPADETSHDPRAAPVFLTARWERLAMVNYEVDPGPPVIACAAARRRARPVERPLPGEPRASSSSTRVCSASPCLSIVTSPRSTFVSTCAAWWVTKSVGPSCFSRRSCRAGLSLSWRTRVRTTRTTSPCPCGRPIPGTAWSTGGRIGVGPSPSAPLSTASQRCRPQTRRPRSSPSTTGATSHTTRPRRHDGVSRRASTVARHPRKRCGLRGGTRRSVYGADFAAILAKGLLQLRRRRLGGAGSARGADVLTAGPWASYPPRLPPLTGFAPMRASGGEADLPENEGIVGRGFAQRIVPTRVPPWPAPMSVRTESRSS